MLLPGSRSLRSRWPYFLGLVAVLLFGCGATFYLAVTGYEVNKQALLGQAQMLAQVINPDDLAALKKTDADLNNPAYLRLKTLLASLRSANNQVRFIRLIGLSSAKEVFFYVDSEAAHSADYAPPGLIYDEASDLVLQTLADNQNAFVGVTDRWGYWLMALAPVPASGGRPLAVVSFAVAGQVYWLELLRFSLVPLLFTILLLAVIMATHYARERERRYLEEKDEFLSIASHEIRAPLTGLRWATETLLLEKNEEINEENKQIVRKMHDDCVGLINNINNLLDLNELDRSEKITWPVTEISLRQLLEEVIESFHFTARARGIDFKLSESLAANIKTRGAPELLRHLFANLISNAVKYAAPETAIQINYQRYRGWDLISISDRGPGLSPTEQKQIFGGFKAVRSLRRANEHGTGIGLYLAQKIAQMHGGSITVASQPDLGSTFTVLLLALV